MITSKIAANQAFTQVNRMHKIDDASRQHHGRDETIKTPKGETVDGIKAEISSFSLNPSYQFNTEFNAVVKSIRIADKAMSEIETNIEQMESEVEMFIKQYPPFPPGSEDRVNYLSRFAMLRKQIDQLTFPPDAGAQQIIGRSSNGSAGDWEIEISGKQIGSTIRRQPVHPGQEGLALPEINAQSTDAQVADMQKALGPARQQVRQSRNMLAEDAIRVIRLAENT
ncbi:MAG: hypothetical protein KQI78_19910 [Deltaproteobacteria bacterium]|nr:hypothetical protein [Deltaproteobacteria bacterium]